MMINPYDAQRLFDLQQNEIDRKHRLEYRLHDVVTTGRGKAAEHRADQGERNDGMLVSLVRRLLPRPGAARKTYA